MLYTTHTTNLSIDLCVKYLVLQPSYEVLTESVNEAAVMYDVLTCKMVLHGKKNLGI
jgi:hypothetical protein